MALDTTTIVVPGGGGLYRATAATVAPTNLASLGGSWTRVGYMHADGWEVTTEGEDYEIFAYDTTDPVIAGVASQVSELSFQLLQWDEENLEFAFGGGVYTAGATQDTFVPPATPTSEHAILITLLNGVDPIGLYWPRMKVTAVPNLAAAGPGGGTPEPAPLSVTLKKLSHASLNFTMILPGTGA